jgi:hypothetical protein
MSLTPFGQDKFIAMNGLQVDKKFKAVLAPPRWSSLEQSTARQSAVRHGVGWCEALQRCSGRTAEGLRTALPHTEGGETPVRHTRRL